MLAEDAVPFIPGQTYEVEIVAQGTTLEVSVDGALIFSVTDPSFISGGIGLYTWGNSASYFDDVQVEDLAAGTVILSEDFDDGNIIGWSITDGGTISWPSAWSATTGTLIQSSNVHSNPTDAASLDKLGTYALYVDTVWTDYRVVVDNTDTAGTNFFSAVGSWTSSTNVPGFIGPNYQYAAAGDGSKTATWTIEINQAGDYEVAARWTSSSNRAPDAPYTILNNGNVLGVVLVDQRVNGGAFVSLGTFALDVGTLEVELTNSASNFVIADAVRVSLLQ